MRKRPTIRRGVRMLALASVLVVLGASQAACNPGPTGPLTVTAQEDVLGLTSRLGLQHPADHGHRAPLRDPAEHRVQPDQRHRAQHQRRSTRVSSSWPPARPRTSRSSRTRPPRSGPASPRRLRATSSRPSRSPTTRPPRTTWCPLRGVSARGTQGNTEPQLSALVDLFGFSTDVGFTGVNQATEPCAQGRRDLGAVLRAGRRQQARADDPDRPVRAGQPGPDRQRSDHEVLGWSADALPLPA